MFEKIMTLFSSMPRRLNLTAAGEIVKMKHNFRLHFFNQFITESLQRGRAANVSWYIIPWVCRRKMSEGSRWFNRTRNVNNETGLSVWMIAMNKLVFACNEIVQVQLQLESGVSEKKKDLGRPTNITVCLPLPLVCNTSAPPRSNMAGCGIWLACWLDS